MLITAIFSYLVFGDVTKQESIRDIHYDTDEDKGAPLYPHELEIMPPAVLTNILRSLTDERSSQGPNNQAFTSALPKNLGVGLVG
jgi:hypothetical protein